MSNRFSNYWSEIQNFLRSTDFSRALVLLTSISIPLAVFYSLGKMEIGVAITTGCLLSAPSDVTGNFRHRTLGVITGAFLAAFATVITAYAAFNVYVLIPVLGLLIFGISYLSVFGFRASLVTFSGLLAIVFSFAKIASGLEIWERGLLVIAGGIWYLLLSLSWHFLKPKRQTEQLFSETFSLTAEFLKSRAKIAIQKKKRAALMNEMLLLQTQLNEKHEILRELLIDNRQSFGKSNYNRKRLLVLIELIDIFEFAISHPVNYEEMDRLYEDAPEQVNALSELISQIGVDLEEIGEALVSGRDFPGSRIEELLQKAEESLEQYKKNVEISEKRPYLLLLRNLYDYQEKQVKRVNTIHRLLVDIEDKKKLFVKRKEAVRFLTAQDYDLSTLTENFNFDSPIFRHALRLAVIVLVGFSIGVYFSFQNAYWILLTIIVIMRPNYGLTKERTKQRIIGTLIGGAIAVCLVLLIQNTVAYIFFGVISLILAFSLLQRNYKLAAVFITISIVFIYALMKPNVLSVIQSRVIDTLLGAALAALGNFFLWPAWEAMGIRSTIAEAIKANSRYLNEIDEFYHQKGKLPVSYKLARKQAFLQMGNLSAAFQRMAQEPKSRQTDMAQIYEIVELNQTFLSALAALGTYIQSHRTTAASENFETFTRSICENLKQAEKILQNRLAQGRLKGNKVESAAEALSGIYRQLVKQREDEIRSGKEEIEEQMRLQLQEAQLISGQLQWLHEISENMVRITANLNNEKK